MSERISTGCSALDELLGGGIERGTVTQLYGSPAAGKTNVALSTAVQVAATNSTAVYIDTEGLSIDRFRQIAEGAADGDIEALTSRIIVSEAHDFDEQREAVRDAGEVAPNAKLIVLDSATGFYRLERGEEAGDEAGDTLRAVASQLTHLLSLARKHDLAVVITNQVYTDPESDQTRGLGGNTLEHWTGTVVRLDRFRGGKRRATLEKHRAMPAGESATFAITGSGLAAVEEF